MPEYKSVSTSLRTHDCGGLGSVHAGIEVSLCGWASRIRDHGGVVFVTLRDRWGETQLVFRPEDRALCSAAAALKPESVVRASGVVRLRPEGLANRAMATGEIEVECTGLEILGPADPLPFTVADEFTPSDELRMKHRYLDLRRPGQLSRLQARHEAARACRQALDEMRFIEVETPMLTRSTPEGARDYLVPSRVFKGSFYALPQSPQLFKQLLMVAGADRYYQIVKCFRDEDLRSDRQPEFTQLDIEMSFAGADDVMAVSETVLAYAVRRVCGAEIPIPVRRMDFDEAIARYGSDKPDLRFGMPIEDLTRPAAGCGFGPFEAVATPGQALRCICVPGGAALSRKQVEALEQEAKSAGLKGLFAMKVDESGLQGSVAKKTSESFRNAAVAAVGAANGDLLLAAAGPAGVVSAGLGAVRLAARVAAGLPLDRFAAVWVVSPPLFMRDEKTGRPNPSHHPFTAPREDDLPALESDPFAARARAYDLVLNGFEVAGGSVRIHRRDVQSRIFSILGISEEKAAERFGFLLEAFKYGAPPHAGIAFGFDRFAMIISGLDQIRDVIAFPKTTSAACLLTGAPAPADEDQLAELGISVSPAVDRGAPGQ